MELKKNKQIETIVSRLDSVLEILTALQTMDMNLAEFTAISVADYLELPIEALAEIREQIRDL